MVYTCQYQSPMGDILLAADEIGLTGLWFVGQKYFANILPDEHIVRETPILAESQRWLDVYFSGEEPNFTPPLHLIGSHSDRKCGRFCCKSRMVRQRHTERLPDNWPKNMAWIICLHRQLAVPVGHNEISIIIPCHRVVGANGSLTGYAGGIDKKVRLLELEKTDMTKFFIQKRTQES